MWYNTGMKTLDLSVIIPFKNHPNMTIDCLKSIESCPIKEILLINNGSNSSSLEKIKTYCDTAKNVKLLHYNHKFNYQKINNWAAAQAKGKVLWLLNNDVEALNPELIEYMYNKALEPKVGATGCVLLYGDKKTVQHAGVYLIPGGTADHLYARKKLKNLLEDPELPYDIREDLPTAAVTAACLIVEKSKFDAIGGLNEDFIITGGDVDLCLRLAEKKFASVLVGAKHGHMLHKESISRSHLGIPYVDFVESYKIYSKHFSTENGDGFIDVRKLKGYK